MGLMKQYESTEVDIQKTVYELILQQFSVMSDESKGLGSICGKRLIDQYNKVCKKRLTQLYLSIIWTFLPKIMTFINFIVINLYISA